MGGCVSSLFPNDNFFPSFLVNRPTAYSSSSIILRGANDFMVDEIERSVHDALCVVKRVLESNTVVPGGGAVETALSIYLENFATSIVCSVCVQRQFLKLPPLTTDITRTAGSGRVCQFPACHPEDVGCECCSRCHQPCHQAQSLP